MFTQTPVHYFFCKMMLLIYLNPLKHSHVKFFCELNFVPILEFAIFYHFYIDKSSKFSEFCIIIGLECMLF